jgi:phosphopantothenoylcysteine decarboxylase/phosphopantothenate--cysteine ligase
VAGATALAGPRGVRRVDVDTAQRMHDAVMAELDAGQREGRRIDVFVGVAAVADWRVANASASKWKKDDSGRAPALEFTENPDILASVARRPDAPYCVGFAAESEKLEEHGAAKRARKGIPLLVANIGPDTFGRDDNELLLIDEHGSRRLPRAGKDALARALADEIAARLDR